MSYILEALRKSQQDRELGRVPTLATQPLFTPQDGGRNSWIGIALGLAALAVAIALYAVLRVRPETAPGVPAPTGAQVTAQSPNQPLPSAQPTGNAQPLAGGQPSFTVQPLAGASAPTLSAPAQATAQVTGQASGQVTAQPHAQAPPQAPAVTTATAGTVASPEVGVDRPVAQVPTSGPAVAPPAAPPGPMAGVAPPASTVGQPGPSQTSVSVEHSPAVPGYGADPTGRAVPPAGTRSPVAAEPHPGVPPDAGGLAESQPSYPPPAPPAPTASRQTPADAVPEDLRQDIEAFKEQLKDGRGGKSSSKASTRPPQVPLRESRLPPEVQERLPSFLLTVHLYDADPAKRLVIIDGRRLRQGDATRSGILVEEIFPDGVALAFEGHRFFQPR